MRKATSGCGGIMFADLEATAQPVSSQVRIGVRQVQRLMQALQAAAELHRAVGGVHTSALARVDAGMGTPAPGGADMLLVVAEDIGRHNTLDRIRGRCLLDGLETDDCILLTTGRISSEMLYKAAHMGVPVIASRTSPTSMAVALGRAWNVTVIGYVRQTGLNVYTGRERITNDEEDQAHANS
jgi:FdhD protein